MNTSLQRTLLIAVLVSLVCAIFIASAAVFLRPAQQANILLDKQKNILQAAGLYSPGQSISKQFEKITPYVVDLQTGEINKEKDANTFNSMVAAKTLNSDVSINLIDSGIEDLAKIGRRENQSVVYLVYDNEQLDKIILPIRGYGLWSTLHGFIALQADANTIAGMGFYQHGETPGLGGEVDNPKWKSIWIGKKLFKGDDYAFKIIKGAIPESSPNKDYKVDGLSGATLTTRGVDNLVRFWIGKSGFQPFLERIKSGSINPRI